MGTWLQRGLWPLALLAALATPRPARALQPLGEFLAGARRASVDDRSASLMAVEAESNATAGLGQALPSISAKGSYTRNQYNVVIPFSLIAGTPPVNFTILPGNQWDAYFELDVPIVNLQTWLQVRAARAASRSARHGERATLLQVEQQVASSYYQLIGAEALKRSAQRTLEVSQANLQLIRDRRQEGLTTELDVNRAAAEVESNTSNIADAELLSKIAQRALLTLTGVAPSGDFPALADDLHEEAPLETWQRTPDDQLPTLQAAVEQSLAAEATQRSAQFALIPSLSAAAMEHLTNATSFVGQPAYYTLVLQLSWRLDVTTLANLKSQSVAAELARVNVERVRQANDQQIYDAWERVHADLIKSRSSRAQVQAAELASTYARERYLEGAGTQLEVVQAQRDAYGAQVAQAQADADLSYARAALHLAAGTPLDPEPVQ